MRVARRELILDGVAGAVAACSGERTARPSEIRHSILDRIANTPRLQLRRVVPEGHARILLKLEGENPTGSTKDRMALAMVEAAERDGRLKPGGGGVEYTGGSTGVSLSLVCRVKGYRLDIVTSDAFSVEKRNHMAALEANLTIVPSVDGGIDATLIRNMIAGAREIVERTGSFRTNQLENADPIAAYHEMGDEIWRQTGGQVDAFVQSVGTSGSLRGNAERLREHNPDVRIVAVEPSVVPLFRPEVVGEIARVSTGESMEMARRLAKKEGLFAGTSTGTNDVVALKKGKELGHDATVVTLMCDSGQKYLSTELYRDGMNAAKEWTGPAE